VSPFEICFKSPPPLNREKQPREVELSVGAGQLFVRLPSRKKTAIADALERLAADPFLVDLHEESGESFLVVAGYVLVVNVTQERIEVLVLRPVDNN
jgi:hypothetical protein